MSDMSSAGRNTGIHVRRHRERREEEGFRQANVWLPEELHRWVAEQVNAGTFKNRSEAHVRAIEYLARANEEDLPQSS